MGGYNNTKGLAYTRRSFAPKTGTLDWNRSILRVHRKTTKTVKRNHDNQQIDRHFVALWHTRHALISRWKQNKLNKRLWSRLEEITREAQTYAEKLATSNRMGICEHEQSGLFFSPFGQPKRKNHALKELTCKLLAEPLLSNSYDHTLHSSSSVISRRHLF